MASSSHARPLDEEQQRPDRMQEKVDARHSLRDFVVALVLILLTIAVAAYLAGLVTPAPTVTGAG